jgi:hypothetical protein
MYVVVAQDSDCGMSVYGPFPNRRDAEWWTDQYNARGIELTVLPVLDSSFDRRRGQPAVSEYNDALGSHFGR